MPVNLSQIAGKGQYRTPLVAADGKLSDAWVKHFQSQDMAIANAPDHFFDVSKIRTEHTDPQKVNVGSVFYEIDTQKSFVSDGSTWKPLASPVPAPTVSQLHSQVFTGNGTFTIPAGVTALRVTVIGGGGGGGATNNTNSGAGGGAGAMAIKWLTGVTPANTLAVTVGGGGAGGVAGANAGSPGGLSSIASGTQIITTVTANGGAGGGFNTFGGTGGTATNGDINSTGNVGGFPANGTTGGGMGAAGPFGGSAQLGFGGAGGNAGAVGAGGGGAGAGGGAAAGGNGGNGIVVLEWVA